MPCIFCGSTTNLTDEHIFPAFIGSQLVLKDGSCKLHNEVCSRFEGELANATKVARHIFNIPNREGRIPDARAQLDLAGIRMTVRVRPNGDIDLHDYVQVVKKNGKEERRGFFVTKEGAERFIQSRRRRGERTTDVPIANDLLLQPESRQTSHFVSTLAARRTIAKISLCALGNRYGIDFALQREFDSLRQYCIGETQSVAVVFFCNELFMAHQTRRPTLYTVNAHLDPEFGKGWAAVTIFGGVSYIVELTNVYQDNIVRSFSVDYDVHDGLVKPVVIYSERDLIGLVLSNFSHFENPGKLHEQWWPIIQKQCEYRGLEVYPLTDPADA